MDERRAWLKLLKIMKEGMSKHCDVVADPEMLVVVWVDAEAGHKAVDHQVHVSALAPRAPGERLGGVEQ